MSGAYDVSGLPLFGPDPQSRRQHSPVEFVNPKAPRFLVTYCHWDYPTLGPQARMFDAALRKNFVETTLLFVPGKNHINEIVDIWKEDDLTANAVLRLISQQP